MKVTVRRRTVVSEDGEALGCQPPAATGCTPGAPSLGGCAAPVAPSLGGCAAPESLGCQDAAAAAPETHVPQAAGEISPLS